MQDGRKAVWSIPYVSVAFFPSLMFGRVLWVQLLLSGDVNLSVKGLYIQVYMCIYLLYELISLVQPTYIYIYTRFSSIRNIWNHRTVQIICINSYLKL